jgi:hypothetical protein
VFVSRGGAVVARLRVTLRRAQPARLALDLDSVVLGSSRSFTVRLRETSGRRPIEGVFVRLAGAVAGGGDFEPTRNLSFRINGDRESDLWSRLPKDPEDALLRRIGAGQQATIAGEFRRLPPGDYRLTLRFLALNAAEDPGPALVVVVHARSAVGWAILALFLATGLSYGVTKWFRLWQLRREFLRRIDALRPDWLATEEPLSPVVRLRTLLRQAQDLNRRVFLSGTAEMDARLKHAAFLVPHLDRLHKIRREIERIPQVWVARRAEKARRQLVDRLDGLPVDERASAQMDAELTALEGWFKGDSALYDSYWAHLKREIESLLKRVRGQLLQRHDAESPYLATLADALEASAAKTPDQVDGMINAELNYAELKVLWERYDKRELSQDLKELIRLHVAGTHGQELLDKSDEMAWRRIETAFRGKQIEFSSPHRDAKGPWEAYEPLLFEVEPVVPAIGDNYLFKHKGLKYEWKIVLSAIAPLWQRWIEWFRWSKARWHEGNDVTLQPATSEPHVLQYLPRPGTVSASVKVIHDPRDETFEVTHDDHDDPIRIVQSRAFRAVEVFEWVETGSFVLTIAVAVATGLFSLYVNNPTFGSLRDYLNLVLWGIGADQTKNVLQIFQRYSQTGGATP